MHAFEFIRPEDSAAAVTIAAQTKTAQQGADVRFLAGGTTLLDLMKLNVETPARLIDINRLPLDKVEATPDGGLKIGATVRNSDLAHHPTVQRDYAVLSQAILAGASAQLRNMATTAGNLLQRTRCMYFRDTAMPCNKREPGTGCPAITGSNRTLAVLGTSEHCIATNPSDMSVAMAALEATVHVQGAKGPRAVPIGDFHLLPGSTPQRETVLEPGDLITHVTLPPPIAGSKQVYLKLRDRASYEFALASAAVVITVAGGKRDAGTRRAGRRGHQAVAISRGRGRARRPAGQRDELPQGGGSGHARRQAAERERVQNRAGEALPHACTANGREQPDSAEGGNMPTTQETPTTSPIGRSTPRVDGPLKVSGKAQYASDFHFPGMLYAVPVEATIANGRVVKLDTAAAENMPGVRAIFHRENIGKIFRSVQGPGFAGIMRRASPAVRGRCGSLLRPIHRARCGGHVRDRQSRGRCGSRNVRQGQAERRHRPQSRRRARRGCHHVRPARAPAEPARRRRGRFRQRAGQARPDLCHAGRDAQPHRAARDDRDLGWIDVDAVRGVAGGRSTSGASSRRCSACRRRTSASSRSSLARASEASCGHGRIVRSPPRRRGSSASRSSSWSAAR